MGSLKYRWAIEGATSFALFNNENIDRPACIHGQGKEADAGCVLIFPPQGFIIPVRDLCQRVIRHLVEQRGSHLGRTPWLARQLERTRSEEHTSELPSLMRNSYAVFCLKKQKKYTY